MDGLKAIVIWIVYALALVGLFIVVGISMGLVTAAWFFELAQQVVESLL